MKSVINLFHRHVKRYGGKLTELIDAECLFRYNEPVSPHLAARLMLGEDGKDKVNKKHLE